MAEMIPERCPSKATRGEDRVFTLLQRLLPEEFTGWYEPIIDGRSPDFTVLARRFGLLFLEIKGWYANQIVKADDDRVELLRSTGGQQHLETHLHPFRQVREYQYSAMDQLKLRLELRQADGLRAGQLVFPCGCGVVLTNIKREELARAGLEPIFPERSTVCRDELDAFQVSGDGDGFARRLRGLFTTRFTFELSREQIKVVRSVIHPEVVVRRPPPVQLSPSEAQDISKDRSALAILDREQERLARSFGEGHAIISGVAGSGKTVLIVARAKLLAMRHPEYRVAIFCSNVSFAAYLDGVIGADPLLAKVEVWSFRRWLEQKVNFRYDFSSREDFAAYESRLTDEGLLRLVRGQFVAEFDAILIDEAQDFHEDWFRIAVAILKGGSEGELMIAVDGAQSIYGRRKDFTWSSVGINARGRSRTLSKNYRNTAEIVLLAWKVSHDDSSGSSEDNPHGSVQPTAAVRSGPKPRFATCATATEERGVVVRVVSAWLTEGVASEEIGVLYSRHEQRRIDDLAEAVRAVTDLCWISDDRDPQAKREFVRRRGVRLCSIHSAKGIQFRRVILVGLDQLPHPRSDDPVRDANLMYVGLTRAEEQLVITWVGRSPFTERVAGSMYADPLPPFEQ